MLNFLTDEHIRSVSVKEQFRAMISAGLYVKRNPDDKRRITFSPKPEPGFRAVNISWAE